MPTYFSGLPLTDGALRSSRDRWRATNLDSCGVGREIEAIRPVAKGLLEHYPGAVMAITTMTAAGREAAERRIPGAAAWMLAPLDKPRAVRSFLERVQPEVVLITETEIWPNYFIESALMGATIAIVNGRMSERSLRRYFRVRGLFEDALHQATLILAQSREDARRYAKFEPAAKVIVTGNAKIEATHVSTIVARWPVNRSPRTSAGEGCRISIRGLLLAVLILARRTESHQFVRDAHCCANSGSD